MKKENQKNQKQNGIMIEWVNDRTKMLIFDFIPKIWHSLSLTKDNVREWMNPYTPDLELLRFVTLFVVEIFEWEPKNFCLAKHWI